MADEMELLKEWIKTSKNIVFFGGAGVSTESNIPDFRSTDGLYHQEYDYPPETILSHSFYMRKPEEFYRFYRNKMLFPNASFQSVKKEAKIFLVYSSSYSKRTPKQFILSPAILSRTSLFPSET